MNLIAHQNCLHHVHSFISNQESNISECVRAMVKRQTKLFPTSIKVDYTVEPLYYGHPWDHIKCPD